MKTLLYYGSLGVATTFLALGFLGMYNRPFDVPVAYSGDGLAGGAQVKGTLETGWYERNPLLGAPFGLNMHDFPLADNLQFVMARFLGLFTDSWSVVYNLMFLATFPLSAMAAAWFIRLVGGSRASAFAFGLLYAFTPYHFVHGQPHLSLSMIFVIPLCAGLLIKPLSDRPTWGRRREGSRWNPWTWATAATATTLVTVVLVGSTSSYYAVFGLLLASAVVVVLLLRREVRRAVGLGVAMCGLAMVMLVNMAPDILYARGVTTSPAAFGRRTVDSEIYSFKFAQLVFPTPYHRISALADFRIDYDTTFPNPAEIPALGVVAAAGFLFLLVLPLVTVLLRRRVADEGPLGSRQLDLALLTFVSFLLGTTGGLGTLFALFVSPDIRAWNRITAYLALFALAAVALLADSATGRLRRWAPGRRDGRTDGTRLSRLLEPGRAMALAVVVVVTLVGLWDQTPPGQRSVSDEQVRAYRNDAAYVASVEKAVAPGTQVFELPYLSYPEATPGYDMQPYDPMRPYLHSHDLRWSYGALTGRPRADWQAATSGLPPARLAVALSASGFGGIHVDRFGYPDHDPGSLESDLRALVGAPIMSPDGRFAFYDLAPLHSDLQSSYTSTELAQIKQQVLRQPIFYWQQGFTGPPTPGPAGLHLDGLPGDPEAIIDNPGPRHELRLRFIVHASAASYPARVQITWPDGVVKTFSVPEEGTKVARNFTAPPGQHSLRFDVEPSTGIALDDWLYLDPGMAFPLRGAAAQVQADAEADAAAQLEASASVAPQEIAAR